jgi:DNA-binding NtrC family response regulator
MSGETVAAVNTILLIEDEPSVTAFVRAALERHGYTVVPASSGAAGLECLEHGSFGGVISDIRMPGAVNGAEVHEWIRLHRPELQQRMILISGDTANSKTQALLANSGIPCIEKPFRVQKLISVVESTFGKP